MPTIRISNFQCTIPAISLKFLEQNQVQNINLEKYVEKRQRLQNIKQLEQNINIQDSNKER